MSQRTACPGPGPLLFLVLTAAAVPALAQTRPAVKTDPAARINALLQDSAGFTGASTAPLDAVPAPAAPPSRPKPPEDPTVSPGLWATLSAPDAETLAWLAKSIPGLDASSIRVMTADAADALVSSAAARGLTALELFTDAGFRGPQAFFIPPAAIAPLFDRYRMHLITPASGVDVDGKNFALKGLLAGRGGLDLLYESAGGKDTFTFDDKDPDDGRRYTLSTHVVQRIKDYGDMLILDKSIQAHYFVFEPEILEIAEISPAHGDSPAQCLVRTSRKTVVKPVKPIRRK